MLVSPEIKELNDKDLEQRFGRTFISYEGKVRLCNSIQNNGAGQSIRWGDTGQIDPFDWTKLNLERPRGRFIKTEEGLVSYICCLSLRQWRRGWSYRSTYDYLIFKNGVKKLDVQTSMLQEWIHGETPKKRVISAAEVGKNQDTIILGPQFLLQYNVDFQLSYLYFRRRSLGIFKNGVFQLKYPQFHQEIREHIPDVQWMKAAPEEQVEAVKRKSAVFNPYHVQGMAAGGGGGGFIIDNADQVVPKVRMRNA